MPKFTFPKLVIAACALHASLASAEVSSVKISRQVPKGGTEGIEVACTIPPSPLLVTASVGSSPTAGGECTVSERNKGETKVTKVATKKITEAVDRFFTRYPKGRTVSVGTAIDVPADSVYQYEIVGRGRKAAGAYGFVDVNRADVDKEAIFDAIVRLQRDITGK